ncbi:hypothetical protein [Pedobacter frigoris]|uniref:Uncharacterized protein n=1 Tax=Pedobacter frigoris TaxID=2571272 RepID=A0A4U1CV47_9SPHI|nr:hypothetical protein [Pedobacter frigoris]TKC09688.1 hypothetical protein FA047_06310 [Pedobacter frigoris]
MITLSYDFRLTDTKMRKLLTLFFFLILALQISCQSPDMQVVFQTDKQDSATGLGEPFKFFLKKHVKNADFNNSKLGSIDDNIENERTLKNLMPIFDAVPGKFNYYQFIATFKGDAYNYGGPLLVKEFHDILIIKTNNDNKIIDSYWYTLEWAEVPLQYDLFRSSVKNLKLSEGLSTTQLKFKREYDSSDSNKDIKENGLIYLLDRK